MCFKSSKKLGGKLFVKTVFVPKEILIKTLTLHYYVDGTIRTTSVRENPVWLCISLTGKKVLCFQMHFSGSIDLMVGKES